MLGLKIIVGSTREGRAADAVLDWVRKEADGHGAFAVDVLDLRDWPLPMFQETFATVGDLRDPTYSDPIVKRWNAKIREGDAFVFVTPEYNHSIPGVLKNAIDTVFASFAFRNKPATAVSYSGGHVGGARAIEQLALIAVEAELVPLRNTVVLPRVQQAFDASGAPTDPIAPLALSIALDDLAWWGQALQRARAEGEPPPAFVRMMAARRSADEAESE